MSDERLAVIIPTKNRPVDLGCLLESISIQGVRPIQVIVVDGGDISAEDAAKKFQGLNLEYVKSPCSLTTQRNIGLKLLKKEATLVSFFDDDIVLEKDALKNMIEFWGSAPSDTGGAGYNNITKYGGAAYKKPGFFERAFFVGAGAPGAVLKSGFLSKVGSLEKTARTEWLSVCATAWRKKIFEEFIYDEWFSGYARYEDTDFSYRVGKKFSLYVVADARVNHFNRIEEENFSFALGKMEIVNRVYFVKKNKNLSLFLCRWACFGLFLNNMIKAVCGLNKRYFLRAAGNAAGFAASLGIRAGKDFGRKT